MATMRDRTVHAVLEDGRQVVRYDRAGKWYIEPLGYPDTAKRRPVSLQEAVAVAAQTRGTVYYGRPGGGLFDKRVATARLAS